MSKKNSTTPAQPKVKTIDTPSARRAQKQLKRALMRPENMEDWDDIDYGAACGKTRKVPMK